MSQTDDREPQPHDREKAIGAAYLRHLGATQIQAASAVGVDRRTVQRWEQLAWWPDVQREAAERWLHGLAARARRGLEAAVDQDGNLALRVLERLEPALAPLPSRVALEVEQPTYKDLTDEQLEQIAAGAHPSRVLAR